MSSMSTFVEEKKIDTNAPNAPSQPASDVDFGVNLEELEELLKDICMLYYNSTRKTPS